MTVVPAAKCELPDRAGRALALAQRFFQLRWIQRVEDSRALIITKAGLAGIEARFGIRTDQW